MSSVNTRRQPQTIQQMLLFRISRFFNKAGGVAYRVCEARFGITRREWGVMATLALHGRLLSSELAEHAQLDRARTSRALTGLEQKGWIARQAQPGNRRCIEVALTEEGQRMYDSILPQMAQIHGDVVSVLSDAELEQLDATLAKLLAHAQTLEHLPHYADLPRIERNRGRKA